MKNIKKIINEELKKISRHRLRGEFISEELMSGRNIVNVDIQPEYENWFSFNVSNWVNFINRSNENNNIIFLYNGKSMGMTSEYEYMDWLMELGITEEVLNDAVFYDKGYNYFRYCMDEGIDEQNIVDLIKYMIQYNINDSRDIDEEMWNNYMEVTGHDQSDVRDLLEEADDLISIPDLMDFLKNYNNIVLTGGGVNECLKEVEIALMALDKPYKLMSLYTY